MQPSLMSEADYALSRNLMVDGQLRPNRVTDRRILDAMRSLPRECYVPMDHASLAYIDQDVPLGAGRVLVKPLVSARLLQLARPRPGETALLVGAGTGYSAAVLLACGVHVLALEEDAALVEQARIRLDGVPNVSVVQGALTEGYAASAPYDLIIIEGAVADIPDAIARQVAAEGRLVTIERREGGQGAAVLAEPSAEGLLSARAAFDASAPYLPGFAPRRDFVF